MLLQTAMLRGPALFLAVFLPRLSGTLALQAGALRERLDQALSVLPSHHVRVLPSHGLRLISLAHEAERLLEKIYARSDIHVSKGRHV